MIAKIVLAAEMRAVAVMYSDAARARGNAEALLQRNPECGILRSRRFNLGIAEANVCVRLMNLRRKLDAIGETDLASRLHDAALTKAHETSLSAMRRVLGTLATEAA